MCIRDRANSKLTVGGTVKLVIINSSFKKPSETLVDQVQTAVDPQMCIRDSPW